LSLRMI